MRKTILIVDDDMQFREMIKMLVEHDGYQSVCAADGISGCLVFAAGGIDLVVVDYSMPDRNGADAASEMRAFNPSIPIVMLSGEAIPPQEVNGQVDTFITKGTHPRILLDEIRRLISLRSQPEVRKRA